MESSEINTSPKFLHNTSTNWRIAGGGSLANSVTVESSLSPINGDDVLDDSSSTVDSNAKSPLILYPPSPNSDPCEITIIFPQKHEVRQVYVRSTARVYEMYCAADAQFSREYLCTVRCGVAIRDEGVLVTSNVDEALLAHLKCSTKESDGQKVRNGSNLNTREDDWVEVKAVDNNSSPSNSDSSTGKYMMDLFEATAELNDVEPCRSLTLRLLSLQNKGCVCIDEIYVFADPADDSNSDNQGAPVENSAGSSLMAMLVPTLFQLSKTRSAAKEQTKMEIKEKQDLEVMTKAANRTEDNGVQLEEKFSSPNLQEVNICEEVGPTESPAHLKNLSGVSSKDDEMKFAHHSSVEVVLEQLVSRVTRVEDLLYRFEENMLKPIGTINERLERLERQVEVLSKKCEDHRMLSGTRICAPEFSCSESESNSYNSKSMDGNMSFEANKRESSAVEISVPVNVSPILMTSTEPHRCLVVTAPEFSNSDEDEESKVVPEKELHKDKQRKPISVDDALASALSGLLSSTFIQPGKSSEVFAVKGPELPDEGENDNEKTDSPGLGAPNQTDADPSPCCTEPDLSKSLAHPVSSKSFNSSLDVELSSVKGSCGNNVNNTDEEVQEQKHNHNKKEGGSQVTSSDHDIQPTSIVVEENGWCETTPNTKDEKTDNESSSVSHLEGSERLEQKVDDCTVEESNSLQETTISKESVVSGAVETEPRPEQDFLKNVSNGFAYSPLPVDFKIPILEVRFASQEGINSKSPLEALMSDTPGWNNELSTVEEEIGYNANIQVDDQSNLIPVSDCGASSTMNQQISVDMDYLSLTDIPVTMEAKKLQDASALDGLETNAGSLI